MGKKPNVLIIHTDQQSTWTLGCYGGTLVDTPHIDSLANEGVLLKNFITPAAVCTPSRGCLVTGRYPHFHGAYKNNVPLNQDSITFADILKDQGYDTGYVGKWHLDGDPNPGWMKDRSVHGFDECGYMHNRGHFKEVIESEDGDHATSSKIGDEKTFTTDFLTDKTIDFINKDREQPFLCMLSIPDPHSPFNVRAPYDTMYKPEDMPIPESFYIKDLPDWAETGVPGRQANYPLDKLAESEAKLRRLKAQYCGEVKCIDDNVGKILNTLKEKGVLDDTIIVFTSDHGEYMGEHGLQFKNYFYETAHRVPMVIRWPAKISSKTVVEPIVSMVDFQPTLLGLMDVQASGREQGKDASPMLMGQDIPWVSECYIHPTPEERAGIFTDEYELAYVPDEFKDHILFDRKNDPDQMINLYHDPAYKNVIDELTQRMVEHFKPLQLDKALYPKAIREKL